MSVPAKVMQPKPKPADYASDQQVRWCPGCGDYAILKGIQKTLAELELARENLVFVSGIGCSSRLPYYLDTYGFHTIHGRAPAVATGIKLSRPELDVWIITGDGDGLSIGGNHLLHLLRRNLDVQVLLFNNEIYGLTKGQYSPTSRFGTRSPSTPTGSLDTPVSPLPFALGAGARFVARVVDSDQKRMPGVLKQAHAHRGAAFVEILQNCIVYNDAVFGEVTDKRRAAESTIFVEHGKPLIYGAKRDRALRLDPASLSLESVQLGEGGLCESEVLCHDAGNPVLAGLLAAMQGPELPVALGVLLDAPAHSMGQRMAEGDPTRRRIPVSELDRLLNAAGSYQVS